MTIAEIRKTYRKDREELRDKITDTKIYEAKDIEDVLNSIGLNGNVIRLKDKKKGVLKVELEKGTISGTIIKFYVYTKRGEVSQLPSDILYDAEESYLLRCYKGVGK